MQTIVIIGGGTAGYHAALYAAAQKHNVFLIEKEKLGGTCVHRGCIPSKFFMKYVKAVRDLCKISGQPFGEGALPFQPEDLVLQAETHAAEISYGISYQLRRSNVQILMGEAQIIDEHQVNFRGKDSEQRISCDHIIVATGSQPKILPKQMEWNVPAYSMDVLFEREQLCSTKKHIAILGAGAVGTEAAMIYRLFGKEVCLLEREDMILPGFDEEIRVRFQGALEECGIHVETNVTDIQEIFDKHEIEAVYVCIGREAVLPVGSRMEPGNPVDTHFQTSIEGMYAIGDCNALRMEANVAHTQAKAAIAHMLTKDEEKQISFSNIPSCIYGPVEGVSLGITSQEMETYEEKYGVTLVDAMVEAGVFGAGRLQQEESSFFKLIYEQESRIIRGMHMLAEHASLLAPYLQVILEYEETVEDVKNRTYLHPTLAEAFLKF